MTLTGGGTVYRLDGFLLDTARGALLGPDGQEIFLRPKAFALLAHLLERPGRLMGREELLEALWPGVAVTDDSLTQCISDLRKAFGESASAILRTVPRRGYILVGDVQVKQPQQPQRQPQAAPAAPAAPPARGTGQLHQDTILVHGFECLDVQPACLDTADTLATELTATLSRFEHLRVLHVSERSGAEGYHLCGKVRLAGAQWRATVRLEDASGIVVWGDRMEWPHDEGPEPPEERLLAIACEVDRQVNREGLRRAALKPAAERTARDCYLLGKDHHQRGTEADTRIAREMFDLAIAANPDYAAAYAWQAYSVQRAITHGWGKPDGQAARDLALQLAQRAVRLAPDSPLCLGRLAFVLMLHQRWDEAVSVAREALRTGRPIYTATRVDCAAVLTATGHAEEAVGIMREGLALDPYCPPAFRVSLGRALLMAGRTTEAVAELQWCAARLPDYAPCYLILVVALTEAGCMEEAGRALRELLRLQPNPVARNHTGSCFFQYEHEFERFRSAVSAARAYALNPSVASRGLT
jgi:DNA-binding winged helix-turn-helix (wHTH) protein/tetratricopeptide (TPR) repeat protein